MPRTKPKALAPAPNSLVASAARLRPGSTYLVPRHSQSNAWHLEAWEHYRNIGEFRYSCDWVGSMLSKALIYATVETVDGVTKVEDGSILDYMSALFGNADGRAEMFRLIGIHMSVTGECYVVGYPDPDPYGDGTDKWEIAASTKCIRPMVDDEPWKINDVTLTDVDPLDVTAIRIWRPDPLEPQLSISPTRAVLSTLRQLHKLGQYISAQLDSRLAGAGILLMPDTMTLPPAPAPDGEPQVKSANNAEELMHILMEAMTASLTNQDSAAAKVPIVVTASAESIAAVKHMTFWSELDQHASELRKEAIGRLALGMDVPPEVLQGASDSNHWSAWQADESAIKAHAQPLLKIITSALGSGYLRPLISVDTDYDGDRLSAYSIAADTSEMRLRPNRSKEALELYNLGELSGAALLRETGFEVGDAMSKEELAVWLTRKVASGSTTPELVQAALEELGVHLTVKAAPAGTFWPGREAGLPNTPGGETVPTEARPAPSLQDHPTQDIPDQKTSGDRKQARAEGRVPSSDVNRKASLLAACDQIVLRALERAGNRLKNKAQTKFTVPASELHCFVITDDVDDMLADAWSYVPMVAERAGLDGGQLTVELFEYTADLLRTQTAHTYERLEAFMSRELVAA